MKWGGKLGTELVGNSLVHYKEYCVYWVDSQFFATTLFAKLEIMAWHVYWRRKWPDWWRQWDRTEVSTFLARKERTSWFLPWTCWICCASCSPGNYQLMIRVHSSQSILVVCSIKDWSPSKIGRHDTQPPLAYMQGSVPDLPQPQNWKLFCTDTAPISFKRAVARKATWSVVLESSSRPPRARAFSSSLPTRFS